LTPMPSKARNLNEVLIEFAELKSRLEDAEQTIDAIRTGEVDALVVRGESGDQVFTLRGADEPYRIFVEQMREGAATLDNSGTIMYCNHAFARIVGEPLERVIGTNLSSYLQDNSGWENGLPDLSKVGSNNSNFELDMGNSPVLCSITPVELDGPAAFAVTITDLTQQKEHGERLTRAHAELEGFCYSVSHDMRAPLRSMVSGASIVLEDYGNALPEVARADLNRIVASAEYLGRLMDDLLTYSRLAHHQIRRQNVDISVLASRVTELIIGERFGQVTWKIEPELSAQGDSRLLEMVLENLLTNAAKFSAHTDRPAVSFGFNRELNAFYVEDNGIGFDMKFASKLFEPFERLHGPSDYPGTGIGLANVKRIVSLHSGKVWANSSEGNGSTFFFTLSEN
jgi:PAS domain S-box-containing protein